MEDIIDIIVTETTNTIEITSQSTDEVIDVNIIDNREDVTLNVTPTVVEININSLTGNFGVAWGEITGTLASQTDLNTALGLKADLVGGKVPSSQLPSYVDDVVEVANYAALPATGETGKIYVVLDTNKIYRWSGSAYIEIADSTAVWGAITGTLSSQTDLQTALNAKFDDPTGDTTQYIAGDGSLITFPVAGQAGTLVREVRNTTGATLTKGTIVYISGATGNKPTVSKAIATGDSTSAQTFGLCQADIANNSNGYIVCVGDLGGLDTSAISEGVQLYLSSTTAGTYTTTKQYAPAHLVYIGVVTRSHPTLGQIEVKIQNGYELDELHNVSAQTPSNNDGLFYESSTSLWKNKSIATVLGYTPANGADYLPLAGGTMTGAIVGTTATFTNSSGIGLGVTQSGPTGDGIKITHSAGRAFNIQSSGGGFGILINNETASTSIPFTIQKQGLGVITFTDAGDGVFASSVTANLLIKSGGTSSQFLKADGSVDSSVYALDSAVVHNTTNENVAGIKTFTSGLSADYLWIKEGLGFANPSGYAQLATDITYFHFNNSNNTAYARFLYGSGLRTYTLPDSNGTIALTSNLSSYLPLSGGTLTGALSGTSASFSSTLTTTTNLSVLASSNAGGNIKVFTSSSVPTQGSAFILAPFGNAILSHNILFNGSGYVYDQNGFGTSIRLSSGSSNPGDIYFNTFTSGTAGASATENNKMIIKQSGNVGIGTTSPGTALAVNAGSAGSIISMNSNRTGGGGIILQNGGGDRMYLGSANWAGIDGESTSSTAIALASAENSAIIFATNAAYSVAERMRITSGGNVTIGDSSTSNTAKLNYASPGVGSYNGVLELYHSTSNVSGSGYMNFYVNSSVIGSIGQVGTTAVAYYTTSDYRLKEDLKPINGLEIVNRINVYDYKWKSDNTRMDGVLAHELAEVLPYAVTGEKDGERMQGVDYSKIVPVLIQAIKDQQVQIEQIKNK